MTRTGIGLRAPIVLTISAGLLCYAGCGKTYETKQDAVAKGPITEPPSVPKPDESSNAKLFADWTKPEPVAAIMISGEQFGYLEPCGCTKGQLGGLGRRLDLVSKIEAQKLPLARVDLGSLTKDPAGARGGMLHAKIKFETALKALVLLKYDALALSAEDLKFGIAETLATYLNFKDQLNIVCANAVPMDDVFKETIKPSVVVSAGPRKIGVTAVLEPAVYAALRDPDLSMLQLKPPSEVLAGVLSKLEGESQVQVLMVQGPSEVAKKLAEAFPGFEFVVSTSDVADPADRPEIVNDGKTQIITVGQKGKYAGIVGLFDDAKNPYKYHRQSLNTRLKNAEEMRSLIDEEMQNQFKSLGVVENYPRHANADAPAGATYVGVETCKICHPNTYAKWAVTKHAKAFDAIVVDPIDPRRKREFDAECVTCHTTGFTYTNGWVSAERTPGLKGNQCENCHGPASRHVEQPDNKEFTKYLERNAETAQKSGFCNRCHDDDNSPGFDFAKHYGQIAHKGMDKYDDPRTHRGLTPKVAAQGSK